MGLFERLAALDAAGLRRRLRASEGADLSSNDYLALSSHPAVRDALVGALAAGVPHGATGSRLLTGQHPAWEAVEARFAAWQGAPAALFVGSGWAANTGLLSALPEEGDVIVSDALNHASLIDGMRLSKAKRVVVPHHDVDAVARALRHADGPAWVVVESVYSMDGDLAPLEALASLCTERGARLVVDEAHATGLFGPEGQGRVAQLGLREAVFASVHTCGKALGLVGAFVVGSEDLRDALINLARPVIFATASPPFLAAGLSAAIDVVAAAPALRARPLALGRRLRAALDGVDTGASESHIVPVITGAIAPTMALADGLRARGWDARPIRPPTVPDGACRVRLVLHAALSDADVDRLAADIRALL